MPGELAGAPRQGLTSGCDYLDHLSPIIRPQSPGPDAQHHTVHVIVVPTRFPLIPRLLLPCVDSHSRLVATTPPSIVIPITVTTSGQQTPESCQPNPLSLKKAQWTHSHPDVRPIPPQPPQFPRARRPAPQTRPRRCLIRRRRPPGRDSPAHRHRRRRIASQRCRAGLPG